MHTVILDFFFHVDAKDLAEVLRLVQQMFFPTEPSPWPVTAFSWLLLFLAYGFELTIETLLRVASPLPLLCASFPHLEVVFCLPDRTLWLAPVAGALPSLSFPASFLPTGSMS